MRYSSTNYYNITPVDIEKVPRARIFNNEVDEHIQKSCKRTLYRSMTRKDGYRNDEVGEIIDLQGNVMKQFDGCNGSLITDIENYYEFLTDLSRLSFILVHNHPNNSSLSFDDLYTFLMDTPLIGVVAVSNNGCVSYAIKMSDNIDFYSQLYWKISLITSHKRKNGITPYQIRSRMLNNLSKYKLKIGRSNRRA